MRYNESSSLGANQRQFTEMIGKLIAFAYANGYELTFSEALRSPLSVAFNCATKPVISRIIQCLSTLVTGADGIAAKRIVTELENFVIPQIASRTSNHVIRLAVDFNLFKDGVYCQRTEDYATLGAYWESLGGRWGGRYGDGNHFSVSYKGNV